MEQSAVVTGASTGIGWAACRELIDGGWRVFGSVRKAADAKRLSAEFGERFTPLIFDVTDAEGAKAGAAVVAEALQGRTLTGLVNNAGIAVAGPLLHLPIDDFRHQLEVNLTGVVIATQAFAPLLGAGPAREGAPGRIVMISSVGGRTALPFLAPYNVSKFGLEGMSEALRRELLIFGVDVVIVAPGPIRTPIWDKADQVDIAPYRDTVFLGALERIRRRMAKNGEDGMPAQAVAKVIHHALTVPKPRVRYVVTPNRMEALMARILPKRLLDRAIGKQLGLLPVRRVE
jgi:NAD(P)-dependent dehydrogenase (short-subunit alcohol dehydrogenase family)